MSEYDYGAEGDFDPGIGDEGYDAPPMAEQPAVDPYIDESVASAIDERVYSQTGDLVEAIQNIPREEWDEWQADRLLQASAREAEQQAEQRAAMLEVIDGVAQEAGVSRYDPETVERYADAVATDYLNQQVAAGVPLEQAMQNIDVRELVGDVVEAQRWANITSDCKNQIRASRGLT